MWQILPRHLEMDRAAAPPATAEQVGAPPRAFTHTPRPAPEPARPAAAPRPPTPAPEPDRPRTDAPPARPSRPVERGTLTLEVVRRVWPRVRDRVTQRSASMRAQFTEDVQVVALEGGYVVIGCPNQFVLDRVDRPKGRKFIEDKLAEELGVQGLKVRCILTQAAARSAAPETSATAPLPLGEAATPSAPAAGGDAPGSFVKQVVDAFNWKLIDE